VAAFPGMLEHDRKQVGWSVGQAAWRLGVSIREYRELEAGTGGRTGRRLIGSARRSAGLRRLWASPSLREHSPRNAVEARYKDSVYG
jgi:hypothetical protein